VSKQHAWPEVHFIALTWQGGPSVVMPVEVDAAVVLVVADVVCEELVACVDDAVVPVAEVAVVVPFVLPPPTPLKTKSG